MANRKKRTRHYQMDGATMAVLGMAMVTLNALNFSAGWILGAAQMDPLKLRPGAKVVASATSLVRQPARPALQKVAVPPKVADFVMPRWSGPPEEQGPPAPPPVTLASIPAPRPRFVPRDYSALIEDAAYRESVPAYLVAAVARIESNFNANAISEKGALGIMQVMPATARRFGFDETRLHDPVHNVAAGATYLRWLMERYDGDLDRVLAAYNAGEGAVDKYDGIPPYKETQDFVKRVRAVLSKSPVQTARAAQAS